ncbi:MAG: coproporphyrinogen III oxidase family protein, partial [Alistipes sp.]|nr:coproporphyrinogen III oxidase family protein [Alistipes sp.]
YEVSNYALPGFRARHNTAYWTGEEYLGIGPAAHSFNGEARRWAAASIDRYLAQAGTEALYEEERLSERDRFNEYLMTGLRRAEGISLEHIETRFGRPRLERLLHEAEEPLRSGSLLLREGGLAIPAERFLISDAVIGTLFEAE